MPIGNHDPASLDHCHPSRRCRVVDRCPPRPQSEGGTGSQVSTPFEFRGHYARDRVREARTEPTAAAVSPIRF